MKSDERKNQIVSAAVKYKEVIYTGLRHTDIMREIREQFSDAYISQEMRGFVASGGQFYNRFQAGAIAFMSGQTATRRESLRSEDLW